VVRERNNLAKEIEMERIVAARPERGGISADQVGAQRSARQRPEASSLCDGDGKIDASKVRHRCRDDRQLDAEQVK
jgi:hypothetical protein